MRFLSLPIKLLTTFSVKDMNLKFRKMKLLKSLGLIGLSLMSFTLVVAQEKKAERTPEEKAEKMTIKISEELGLDANKTKELKVLNENFVRDMQRIKSDPTLEKKAYNREAKALKDDRKVNLKKLLSEKEYAEYESLEAKKIARHTEKKKMNSTPPSDRAANRTKKMTEHLSLTPDQIKKITPLNESAEMKIEAIKKDDALSEEKKKELIKVNRKEQIKALKSILTEEQLIKLKEAKKSHHRKGE